MVSWYWKIAFLPKFWSAQWPFCQPLPFLPFPRQNLHRAQMHLWYKDPWLGWSSLVCRMLMSFFSIKDLVNLALSWQGSWRHLTLDTQLLQVLIQWSKMILPLADCMMMLLLQSLKILLPRKILPVREYRNAPALVLYFIGHSTCGFYLLST